MISNENLTYYKLENIENNFIENLLKEQIIAQKKLSKGQDNEEKYILVINKKQLKYIQKALKNINYARNNSMKYYNKKQNKNANENPNKVIKRYHIDLD